MTCQALTDKGTLVAWVPKNPPRLALVPTEKESALATRVGRDNTNTIELCARMHGKQKFLAFNSKKKYRSHH